MTSLNIAFDLPIMFPHCPFSLLFLFPVYLSFLQLSVLQAAGLELARQKSAIHSAETFLALEQESLDPISFLTSWTLHALLRIQLHSTSLTVSDGASSSAIINATVPKAILSSSASAPVDATGEEERTSSASVAARVLSAGMTPSSPPSSLSSSAASFGGSVAVPVDVLPDIKVCLPLLPASLICFPAIAAFFSLCC